jgi:hypothetical protein
MQFYELESKIYRKDIFRIEKKYGVNFPSRYVDHLLKYNGGRCEPDVFSFIEDNTKEESRIDYFHAIASRDDYDLENCINDLNGEGRITANLIPIATDPFGNYILISCRGIDFGSLFFWNHESEFEASYEPSFLADSLDVFLASLYHQSA